MGESCGKIKLAPHKKGVPGGYSLFCRLSSSPSLNTSLASGKRKGCPCSPQPSGPVLLYTGS